MPKPDIGQKLRFFASIRGSRWNTVITFGVEKPEWCGYPMVNKFSRYVHSFQQNTRT